METSVRRNPNFCSPSQWARPQVNSSPRASGPGGQTRGSGPKRPSSLGRGCLSRGQMWALLGTEAMGPRDSLWMLGPQGRCTRRGARVCRPKLREN